MDIYLWGLLTPKFTGSSVTYKVWVGSSQVDPNVTYVTITIM